MGRGGHPLRSKPEPGRACFGARTFLAVLNCLDLNDILHSLQTDFGSRMDVLKWWSCSYWFAKIQIACGFFFCCFGEGAAEISYTHPGSSCETKTMCANHFVPPHAANRKEGSGGGRPKTGMEETLPEANAIWGRGGSRASDSASVWADVFLLRQPQHSAGRTFATCNQFRSSSYLRGCRGHFIRRNIGGLDTCSFLYTREQGWSNIVCIIPSFIL